MPPLRATPASDLALVASLSREMYDGAILANATYQRARDLVAHLEALVVEAARDQSLELMARWADLSSRASMR